MPHAMLSYTQPYPVQNYRPSPLEEMVDAYTRRKSPSGEAYQHKYPRTTTTTARPWPEEIWNRPEKVFYFGKTNGYSTGRNLADNRGSRGTEFGFGQVSTRRLGATPTDAWSQAYLQHAITAGDLTRKALLRQPASVPQGYPSGGAERGGGNFFHTRDGNRGARREPKKIITRAEVHVETTVAPWQHRSFQVRPAVASKQTVQRHDSQYLCRHTHYQNSHLHSHASEPNS